MDEYRKAAENIKHDRLRAFYRALEYFKLNPINALVIGSERSTDVNGIYGDGWFSFYLGFHIERYGGSLLICDTDPEGLKRGREMLSDFYGRIKIDHVVADGKDVIDKQRFNLVYLDGGDDPFETLVQFEKVNRKEALIFCDDYHGKGVELAKRHKDYEIICCNWLHKMAIYYPT